MILRELEQRIRSLSGASDWAELGRLICDAATEATELSIDRRIPCRAVTPVSRIPSDKTERRHP
jgi:hypothetical protein